MWENLENSVKYGKHWVLHPSSKEKAEQMTRAQQENRSHRVGRERLPERKQSTKWYECDWAWVVCVRLCSSKKRIAKGAARLKIWNYRIWEGTCIVNFSKPITWSRVIRTLVKHSSPHSCASMKLKGQSLIKNTLLQRAELLNLTRISTSVWLGYLSWFSSYMKWQFRWFS